MGSLIGSVGCETAVLTLNINDFRRIDFGLMFGDGDCGAGAGSAGCGPTVLKLNISDFKRCDFGLVFGDGDGEGCDSVRAWDNVLECDNGVS